MSRDLLILKLVAAALAVGGTGAVFAQDDNDDFEEIVVTGTHLGTSGNVTSPVATIDGTRVDEVPRASLADFLFSELPQSIGLDANYDESAEQGRDISGARAAGVDLRGLGKENTLTLINGRRTIEFAAPNSDGWRNVDVNSLIPRIALQRMEVLLDGGSAVYGTDAVAGVVNVIPKYEFEGMEVRADSQHHQEDFGAGNWSISGIGGFGNDRTNFVAAFEVHRQDRADVYDVGLEDYPSASPGPDDDAFLDRIANGTYTWRALGAAMGMGGGGISPTGDFLVDPLCGDASALGSEFLAGNPNLDTASVGMGMGAVTGPVCSTYAGRQGATLRNEQERLTAFAAVKHSFSDQTTLTVDFSYANREIYDVQNEEQTTFAIDEALLPYQVPANHPGVIFNAEIDAANWSNPLGYQVLTGYSIGWGDQIRYLGSESEMMRLGATLEGAFNANWTWELNATAAENSVFASRRRLDLTPQANGEFKLANALNGLGGPDCDPVNGTAGSGGCEWFNPFMNRGIADADAQGLGNSSALLEWLRPDQSTDYDAEFYDLSAMVTGALPLEFSGGPVQVALGFEHRNDDLSADRSEILNRGDFDGQGFPNQVGQEDFASEQTVNSVFFEALVPFSDTFEAQIAGRYEDYDGDFDTFDPKIGVHWAPTDALDIRASYGTSFKAPTVIHTDVIQSRSSFVNLCDREVSTTCRAGGASLGAGSGVRLVLSQAGNPDIDPQESDNFSFGIDYAFTDNFSAGLDYVNIAFENLIDLPSATDTLRDPACNSGTVLVDTTTGLEPLFVPVDDSANNRCFELDETFDPSNPAAGGIRTVFVNPRNLSSVDVEAIDFRFNWNLRLGAGDLNISPRGTYLLTWEEQVGPGEPVTDFVGQRTVFGPGFPEWKANLPISWSAGNHQFNGTLRYLGPQDSIAAGGERVPSWVQIDLGYAWQATEKLMLKLAVNNAADRNPGIRQATLPRYRRVFVFQADYAFFD